MNLSKLTKRERQIVDFAARGISARHTAKELGITPGTVKVHLFNAYEKLGVHNRIQLMHVWLKEKTGEEVAWMIAAE